MAHKMADAQNSSSQLKAAFATFDKNGDGNISAEELRELMSQLGTGAREEDIANVMESLDVNHDGHVSYNEVARFVTREMRRSGYSFM